MKHTKQFGKGRASHTFKRRMGRIIRRGRKLKAVLDANALRIADLRERLCELERKLP